MIVQFSGQNDRYLWISEFNLEASPEYTLGRSASVTQNHPAVSNGFGDFEGVDYERFTNCTRVILIHDVKN